MAKPMTSSTYDIKCPPEYSEVNEENTPCPKCGSRIHFIGILTEGSSINCSWCGEKIDDVNPELIPLIIGGSTNE